MLSGSSSCGMEAIVIQRPLPTESYSWSDIPLVVQDDSPTKVNTIIPQAAFTRASTRTSTSTFTSTFTSQASNIHHNTDNNDDNDDNNTDNDDDASSLVSFSHSSSSTLSTSASGISIASGSSYSSCNSINGSYSYNNYCSERSLSNKENDNENNTTTTDLSASGKKNVRFAPSPHVRTYSLVLGNHPLCDDGLAIELGWDYSEEEHNNNNNNYNSYINYVGGHPLTSQQQQQLQQQQFQQQQQHQHHQQQLQQQQQQQLEQHVSRCQRRSYLSRKQLLLDVAGCTKEELDQRTRDFETKKALLEQAISHREDYYYCLAFAKR